MDFLQQASPHWPNLHPTKDPDGCSDFSLRTDIALSGTTWPGQLDRSVLLPWRRLLQVHKNVLLWKKSAPSSEADKEVGTAVQARWPLPSHHYSANPQFGYLLSEAGISNSLHSSILGSPVSGCNDQGSKSPHLCPHEAWQYLPQSSFSSPLSPCLRRGLLFLPSVSFPLSFFAPFGPLVLSSFALAGISIPISFSSSSC